MSRSWQALACVLLLLGAMAAAGDRPAATRLTVSDSAHNLSPNTANGPNVCIYCHAPHNAAPVKGLWNHQLSKSEYKLYNSSSYRQGAPTLASNSPSRLCLSCHDGTVALGSTYSAAQPLPTRHALPGSADLGTDLSTDHPFGFDRWVRDNTLRDELFATTPRVTADAGVKLKNERIECTTCHEPHVPNIDVQRPTKFLAVSNASGSLCAVCHDLDKPSPNLLSGWKASAHALSSTTEGAVITGYSSVAEGACLNCHTSHGSGSERLLRQAGESGCFACHANNSSAARWAKTWVGHDDASKFMHPVTAPGHRPDEDLRAASTPRHSECWDCHNPHATRQSGTAASPPLLENALAGASGVDRNGSPVAGATNEYEVCFKCHADSGNKPQMAGYGKFGYTPVRQVDAHNVRLDFESPFARHNVVSGRSGTASPTLRAQMLRFDNLPGRSLGSGYLYCTDCHNNNNAQSSGGTGANGPHISAYEHLLERRYDMNRPPATPGAAVTSLTVPSDGGDPLNGPFALCNKCHEVARLLTPAGDTGFKYHATHVVAGGISCAACHASHGVQGSDAGHHAHSINLDLSMVGPDPASGRLEIDTAGRTCTLACHFSNYTGVKIHSGTRY